MERARGIEPPSKAWEAFVLPLNYARARKEVKLYRRSGPGAQQNAVVRALDTRLLFGLPYPSL